MLIERLLARAQAQGRSDDTEQVIRHRLRVLAAATAPLLAYYRDQGPAISAQFIDATGPPDDITWAILALATADA